MSLVVLQPCSAAVSRKHYEETVESPVDLQLIASSLQQADLKTLQKLYPSGKVPLWGTRPGEKNQLAVRWARMRPGDIVLFGRQGEFYALGVVSHVLRSAAAATQLWGTAQTANGLTQTWECMFAIDELRSVAIPNSEINQLIGRAATTTAREIQVLPQDQSDAVLAYLDMLGNDYAPVPDEPTYANSVADPQFAQMEQRVEAIRRAEQAFLRKRLFPGDTAHCAICSREYPVRFLVAAHIKRRAACTDDEKRDYANVVMPNCKFGCDELFGRGLVSVDNDGNYQVSPMLDYGDAVNQYLKEFVFGRSCAFWHQTPAAQPYFEFHWKTDFKNAILQPEAASV